MEIEISNSEDLAHEFKKVEIQYNKYFTIKTIGTQTNTSCSVCVEIATEDQQKYNESRHQNPDLPVKIFEEPVRKSMNCTAKKQHLYNAHRAACIVKIQMKKIGSSGNVTGKKKKQQGIQNFISQVSTTKQPKLDEFRPPTSSEKRERDVETALRCIKLQSIKSACDDPTITLSYEDKFIQMPAADPKKKYVKLSFNPRKKCEIT